MTIDQRTRSQSVRRPGLILLLLGVAIGVIYTFVIEPNHLFGIGEPTDIGGGLIPLASVILTFSGLVLLITSLFTRRR
jgi:polyferredoxin